jgi:5-formyltetrahydrofolate cyclo-ligase
MTDTMTDKIAIRQQIRKRRSALPAYRQHIASIALARRVLRTISAIHRARKIAFYLAQDGEIDVFPLMLHCYKQQQQCFLPVLDNAAGNKLSFAEWTPEQVMLPNRYGIAEPAVPHHHLKEAADMDLIFMPLVAFDASGHRLGMGGGYYDRSLAGCFNSTRTEQACRPFLVAAGHDIQFYPRLPHDPWDIIPDITITPGRILKTGS